ncbi:MAG: XrtA/PEP-CTERM system exopolysaccharide export protein [Tistlia sp.]|uniref:XrtA/PEP-CTERM system exopolysaccharide export protein n=1 Tax=Tistlia sp. TaxID=3057121 RepID=UPI0034A56C41
MRQLAKTWGGALALLLGFAVAGCASNDYPQVPAAIPTSGAEAPDYRIGPLDSVQIFVWRAPELTTSIPVRPDGRISTPLVDDMVAAGKTPTQLSRDLEEALLPYVQDPVVTVLVNSFVGPFTQQVRVVGEAQRPVALPYRTGMTVLDVMIEVGGLTEFAAGNGAVLIRGEGPDAQRFSLALDDLLRDGDIDANAPVLPGDVILIPESWL